MGTLNPLYYNPLNFGQSFHPLGKELLEGRGYAFFTVESHGLAYKYSVHVQ